MNYNNALNVTHSKSKVQWWSIFAIFGMVLSFTACEKDCNCPEDKPKEYPSLMVVNQNTDRRVITAVRLVGYEFTNLSIDIGDSQTFTLNEGMPGGYININTTVSYKYGQPTESKSIEVNFSDGETSTITLKGCISFEGCSGFYLE